MASKWEPHAEEIEAAFLRGDSYRTISAALLERHGLPLDPAGLHRWWKNKLAKRQAREAVVRPHPVTDSAALAAALVQELAVAKVINEPAEAETKSPEKVVPPAEKEKVNSMKEIIAEAEASSHKSLLRK